MKILLRLIVFISFISLNFAHANFGEMFGSSTSTSSVAGQTTGNLDDPANNFYAPSLLAWSKKPQFSFNTYYVLQNFKKINNVLIRNQSTSGAAAANTNGSIQTNYKDLKIGTLHFSLPINGLNGKLLGSVFFPIAKIQSSSSGDPFLTEYVMYRGRNERTVVYLNYAFELKNDWAMSLGIYNGIQTSSSIFTRTSDNTTDNSYSRMDLEAKPSIAGIFSVSKKWNTGYSYFTFQQEMKSKFKARAYGENDNPAVPYDMTMSSLLYYDPMTARLGHVFDYKTWKLLTSVEYQYWENYQTPVIRITKNNGGGAVGGSQNFETVKTRNIFIPKIGYSWNFSEKSSLSSGLSYRQSPLGGNFSGPGNSIDTDSVIASLGLSHQIEIFGKKMNLGTAVQYHHLIEKTITKTSGQENGSAGSKIGSPGYKAGGKIINASIGLRLGF